MVHSAVGPKIASAVIPLVIFRTMPSGARLLSGTVSHTGAAAGPSAGFAQVSVRPVRVARTELETQMGAAGLEGHGVALRHDDAMAGPSCKPPLTSWQPRCAATTRPIPPAGSPRCSCTAAP